MNLTNWRTSAFADEAGSSIETQISALKRAGIEGIDVRNLEGVNVLDLSDEQLATIRFAAGDAGIFVQAVGSPVNKVVLDPQTKSNELEKLRRAIHAAHQLETKNIRIFTPEAPLEQKEEVFEVVRAMVELAKTESIVLLHENDSRYFGAFPVQAKMLFEEFGGTHFQAAFDFANTVQIGFSPANDWLPWIVPYLSVLHIKDAKKETGAVVPAGEGDGEILDFIANVVKQGWSGTLTLEPHLQSAGRLGGFSGPELFQLAAEAMFSVATKAGLAIAKQL